MVDVSSKTCGHKISYLVIVSIQSIQKAAGQPTRAMQKCVHQPFLPWTNVQLTNFIYLMMLLWLMEDWLFYLDIYMYGDVSFSLTALKFMHDLHLILSPNLVQVLSGQTVDSGWTNGGWQTADGGQQPGGWAVVPKGNLHQFWEGILIREGNLIKFGEGMWPG